MPLKGDRAVNPWTQEGSVLRVSIGLEQEDDLWSDLQQLLAALHPAIAGA
ncbi:hypothetical protein [Teichococcus vastitatis]|uniref:Cys/Met metabolism PLP-dependent enzyme n=2 Tax=Teichococcus vastitatis TaxID=2307076 RepID=A0ABS9W7F7_9PROT|nr:hypothetical protein [Pseudoroseomonas vastitatis]MCI0755158.1 hypothetical protein [Pseudoroseomonas vastitatis]